MLIPGDFQPVALSRAHALTSSDRRVSSAFMGGSDETPAPLGINLAGLTFSLALIGLIGSLWVVNRLVRGSSPCSSGSIHVRQTLVLLIACGDSVSALVKCGTSLTRIISDQETTDRLCRVRNTGTTYPASSLTRVHRWSGLLGAGLQSSCCSWSQIWSPTSRTTHRCIIESVESGALHGAPTIKALWET